MKLANAQLNSNDEKPIKRRDTTQPRAGKSRLRREVDENRRDKRRRTLQRDVARPKRKIARDTILEEDGAGAAIPEEETVVITSRDTKGENVALEIKALMSICQSTTSSVAMLGNLTEQHFHTQEVKIAFKRVKFLHQRTGTIPDFQTLLNEPSISVASRERISATIVAHHIKPCRKDQQYRALFRTMDDYAKKRKLYEALNRVGDMVRQDGMDVDTALSTFQREAANLSQGFDSSTISVSGGASDSGPENTDLFSVAMRVMSRQEVLNATGMKAYDRVNGGSKPKSLIMFGADTSNYKSVMMLQHAINQAAEGKRVAFYSLEMDEDQCYQRFFANLASIDVLREIVENTRAANLEKNVARIVETVKEIWANWTLISPAQSVTWDWIVAHAESIDAEVLYVDYIGLLAGARGEGNTAQWQALDGLTRDAKVYANVSGRTVVLAAQMRFTEGRPELKYATAMKDHADLVWAWSTLVYDGRTYLCIHVDKARGGRRFKFVMEVVPKFSKIIDVDLRDKTIEEMVNNAIADMEAYKDPQARYKEVNVNGPNGRRSMEDPDRPKGTSVAVTGGGFAGGVHSVDVSASDDAPWDTDHTKAKRTQDVVANSVSELALAQAAVNEQRTKYGKGAFARRQALDALVENKVAGLNREQMAEQAKAVLKLYDTIKAETTYGFDVLAEDIIKMQSSLAGLRSTVDSQKAPELASVLNNERDKSFKRRATPSERAAHQKRIAFVQAAIKKVMEAKGKREKLRIQDLSLVKRYSEEHDGTQQISDVVDPSAATNSWETNAVLFEDRQGVNLPNFAKPVNRRWKLDQRRLEDGNRRVLRFAKGDHGRLVRMEWPAENKLTYLSDAQLEHMVTLTNRWRGVPVAETVSDHRYKRDLSVWLALVSPARKSKGNGAVRLSHEQFEALKTKYNIGSREKVDKNEQAQARRISREAVAESTRRHCERVEAYRTVPEQREARQVYQ
jgi:replicative DNA helicase